MSTNETRKLVVQAQEFVNDLRVTTNKPMFKSRLEDIVFGNAGYAENGYVSKTGVIAFSNWNDIDGDKSMTTLVAQLEKLGIDCAWKDEWACCDRCNKAVRIHGDTVFWQPAYDTIEDEKVCHMCLTKDKSRIVDYLAYLENKHAKAVTIDIEPSKYGYKKVDQEFENGWYGGQCDDPELVANDLRKQNITRFVFKIDTMSPFELKFSVYIHKSEWRRFKNAHFRRGADPAEELKTQLQSARVDMRRTLQAS